MQLNSIEEFEVWQHAWRLVEAISAITSDGPVARDLKLRSQLDDSGDSMLSNLAEGFEQGTDRAFARYVVIARGSCAEARLHLGVARLRGHIPADVARGLREDATRVVRMLTGLNDYLLKSDRKRRR